MRQFPDTEAFLNQSYRSLQWGKGYFSILHRTLASRVNQLF
jgi:hypothetical protein